MDEENAKKWMTVYEKLLSCYVEDSTMLMEVARKLLHVEENSPSVTLSGEGGEELVQIPLQILLRLNTLLVSFGSGLTDGIGLEDGERATETIRAAFSITLSPVVDERALLLVNSIFHPDIAKAVKANLRARDSVLRDAITAVGQADEKIKKEKEEDV